MSQDTGVKQGGTGAKEDHQHISIELMADGAKVTALTLNGSKLMVTIEAELANSMVRSGASDDKAGTIVVKDDSTILTPPRASDESTKWDIDAIRPSSARPDAAKTTAAVEEKKSPAESGRHAAPAPEPIKLAAPAAAAAPAKGEDTFSSGRFRAEHKGGTDITFGADDGASSGLKDADLPRLKDMDAEPIAPALQDEETSYVDAIEKMSEGALETIEEPESLPFDSPAVDIEPNPPEAEVVDAGEPEPPAIIPLSATFSHRETAKPAEPPSFGLTDTIAPIPFAAPPSAPKPVVEEKAPSAAEEKSGRPKSIPFASFGGEPAAPPPPPPEKPAAKAGEPAMAKPGVIPFGPVEPGASAEPEQEALPLEESSPLSPEFDSEPGKAAQEESSAVGGDRHGEPQPSLGFSFNSFSDEFATFKAATPPAREQPAPELESGKDEEKDTESARKREPGATTVLIRYTCPKCKTQGMQAVDKVGTVVTCSNCGKAMRLIMKK